MANVTTITAATIIPEIWSTQVELAAYNRRGFSGRIIEVGFSGPGDIFHIPKIGQITASAFSGTVSYTANTETSIDITPDVSYAAVQIDRKAERRAVVSLGNLYQVELGRALAQYEDEQIAGLYSGLSQNVGGSGDFTEANYLAAIGTIIRRGKDKVTIGEDTIWGVYHPIQWDVIAGISNIVSAEFRGEQNGAARTGRITLAYGVTIDFSSSVQVSTTARNLIWKPNAFAIARKLTPTVLSDLNIDGLAVKVVAEQDFGVAEVNDELAVEHRTAST